jgi:cyclase
VYRNTGDPSKTVFAGLTTAAWVIEAQERGAGEIVLNCMNRDGVRQGYDIAQLRQIRAVSSVPLIASGGAGTMDHFGAVFAQAVVDGALAASVFHRSLIHIGTLKGFLRDAGIEVRP